MLNKRKTRSSTQTEYERQRQMNIEKNAMRFQELGLSKLANQLITKAKGHQGKERDNHVLDEEDQEYIPEENGDEDILSTGEEHAIKNVVLNSTTNCISNKVRRVTTRRCASIKKSQPSCPAMSIAEFLHQRKQQGSTQVLEGSHSMHNEEGQRSIVEHSPPHLQISNFATYQ